MNSELVIYKPSQGFDHQLVPEGTPDNFFSELSTVIVAASKTPPSVLGMLDQVAEEYPHSPVMLTKTLCLIGTVGALSPLVVLWFLPPLTVALGFTLPAIIAYKSMRLSNYISRKLGSKNPSRRYQARIRKNALNKISDIQTIQQEMSKHSETLSTVRAISPYAEIVFFGNDCTSIALSTKPWGEIGDKESVNVVFFSKTNRHKPVIVGGRHQVYSERLKGTVSSFALPKKDLTLVPMPDSN